MPSFSEGLTKKQQYLINESEKLMNNTMEELENHLDVVESTYLQTLQFIIARVNAIYKKYQSSPESVKQYQIQNAIRLQKIAEQIEARLEQLGIEFTDSLKGSLHDNFVKAVKVQTDAVNKVQDTNYDYKSFSFMSTVAVEHAIMFGYQGYQFEVDFKGKTKVLGKRVNAIIAQGVATGEGNQEIAKKLQEEFDLHIFHAKRIARTETSRVTNNASLQVYQEMGYSEAQWLDSTESIQFYYRNGGKRKKAVVCSHCRANATGGLNGDGIYPLNSFPPIPAHPHCRCTVSPIINSKN